MVVEPEALKAQNCALSNFCLPMHSNGLGWKRLANGSVSKRHHTSLFAQLSKILLVNVNIDRICQIFDI